VPSACGEEVVDIGRVFKTKERCHRRSAVEAFTGLVAAQSRPHPSDGAAVPEHAADNHLAGSVVDDSRAEPVDRRSCNVTGMDAATTSGDFRSIVLRRASVASYKFALAKSILSLAESGAPEASLEDLAVPFGHELCTHLKDVDTQSTSSGSRFLDACRHFNAGRITQTELVETTVLFGFNNVIDAFHIVDRSDVSARFFVDERQQSLRGSASPTSCSSWLPTPTPKILFRRKLNPGGSWLRVPGSNSPTRWVSQRKIRTRLS
jgi:hypothetical protein